MGNGSSAVVSHLPAGVGDHHPRPSALEAAAAELEQAIATTEAAVEARIGRRCELVQQLASLNAEVDQLHAHLPGLRTALEGLRPLLTTIPPTLIVEPDPPAPTINHWRPAPDPEAAAAVAALLDDIGQAIVEHQRADARQDDPELPAPLVSAPAAASPGSGAAPERPDAGLTGAARLEKLEFIIRNSETWSEASRRWQVNTGLSKKSAEMAVYSAKRKLGIEYGCGGTVTPRQAKAERVPKPKPGRAETKKPTEAITAPASKPLAPRPASKMSADDPDDRATFAEAWTDEAGNIDLVAKALGISTLDAMTFRNRCRREGTIR